MKKLLFPMLALCLFQISGLQSQNVRMVKDLVGGSPGGFDPEDTGILTALDTLCIFLAADKSGSNRLVCSSNGTSNGTVSLLPPLTGDDELKGWAVSGGKFWFIVKRGGKHDLYASNGTVSGTKLKFSSTESSFSLLRAFQGDVVFREVKSDFSGELLQRMSFSENSPTTVGSFYWFGGLLEIAASDNQIWAIGQTSQNEGRFLVKSDGSPNSLVKIREINTGSEFNQRIWMTPVGSDRVFFFWQKGNEKYRLWTSDGTENGTIALKEYEEEFFVDLREERSLAAFGNQLIFRAREIGSANDAGNELHISDGTLAGTKLLKDLEPGNNSSTPQEFTIWNGKLWFSAKNGAWNQQLWSTDGTAAGTVKAFQNFDWNEYHGIDLTVFNDSLAFGGQTIAEGGEIFLSLGTDASTVIRSDQSPANDDYFYPNDLTDCKKFLFFTGRTQAKGRELWLYAPNEKLVVSTQTPENEPFANVSPNPGGDFLKIENAAPFRLEVFGPGGDLVLKNEFPAGASVLKTSTWPSGNYVFRVMAEEKIGVLKWVKG